jgi:hypothetical protein
MQPYELRNAAKSIAADLMADLKAGKYTKIGADEIEAACDAAVEGLSSHDREVLVTQTCRAFVNLAL